MNFNKMSFMDFKNQIDFLRFSISKVNPFKKQKTNKLTKIKENYRKNHKNHKNFLNLSFFFLSSYIFLIILLVNCGEYSYDLLF